MGKADAVENFADDPTADSWQTAFATENHITSAAVQMYRCLTSLWKKQPAFADCLLFCLQILCLCIFAVISKNVADKGNQQKHRVNGGDGIDNIWVQIRQQNQNDETDEQNCGTDLAGHQSAGKNFALVQTGETRNALKAFLDYILPCKSIKKVYGICMRENIASVKVLEKCGFTKEFEGQGKYQGEIKNIVRYVFG